MRRRSLPAYRVFSASYDLIKSGGKSADREIMSAINTNPLSSAYVESLLSGALQNNGINAATAPASNAAAASIGTQQDSGQLSPLAQLLSTLQQLQQSNPTQYAQVTQQIATNLQAAAQTATADGNTSAANQLTTLATDFTNASTSGQLPDIKDLAQAIGGGGGHHHHHHFHTESSSGLVATPATATSTDTSGATPAAATSANT